MKIKLKEQVRVKGTSKYVYCKVVYQIGAQTMYITYDGDHYREDQLETID